MVDIAGSAPPEQPVPRLLADHRGDLLSFAVSFLVIAQFWGGHRRTWERLVDYDETLLSLNTFWLMAVVFLPFPTARLFVQSRLSTGSAVLYLGTMLLVSLLSLAQSGWIVRHPRLTGRPVGQPVPPRRVRWAPLLPAASVAGMFAVATVAALFASGYALYLLRALPLVQRLARRRAAGATR